MGGWWQAAAGSKTTPKEIVTGVVVYRRTLVAGRTVVLQARGTVSTRWTSINQAVAGVRTAAVSFTLTQTGHREQYRLIVLAGAGMPGVTATS